MKSLTILLAALLLSGCANVMAGTGWPINTLAGPPGACPFRPAAVPGSNPDGPRWTTPQAICPGPGLQAAAAPIIPGSALGNMGLGSLIGAAISAASAYPENTRPAAPAQPAREMPANATTTPGGAVPGSTGS
jgi:predicted small secreted protein